MQFFFMLLAGFTVVHFFGAPLWCVVFIVVQQQF